MFEIFKSRETKEMTPEEQKLTESRKIVDRDALETASENVILNSKGVKTMEGEEYPQTPEEVLMERARKEDMFKSN